MNLEDRAGQRVSGPLVSMVAAATSYALYTKGTGSNKKTRIKKIFWCNRNVNNGVLRIGYLTVGAVFVQVLPDIFMIGGSADGQLLEEEIPQTGNAPDGFIVDTTLVTGSTGDIIGQTTLAGAAPNDVQVKIEVEEE